jgi:hypothetical protein
LAGARGRRPRGRIPFAIAAMLLTVALASGCAAHKVKQPVSQQGTIARQVADNAPMPGPEAKIHISYAHADDFLSSLTVTKYSGAQSILTLDSKDGQASSIIRFDGGTEVWRIDVDKPLLSGVPVLGSEKGYAPAEVSYGSMPQRFLQSVPDGEPPEPLESDRYYIFAVTRASGSASYEAVKVDGDGSLEAYDAEPRAGTSFRLCCNLGADFTVATTPRSDAGPAQP